MSLTNPVTNTEQTKIIYMMIEALSYIDTSALAHADDFPGTVTETTKAVDFIFTAPTERDGFFFTGLYAKPGDEITFEVTENTEKVSGYADINVKSDGLTDRIGKELTRFPKIGARTFRIRGTVADKFASAHGGLIFLRLS